mgnify:CR=1 FL=1
MPATLRRASRLHATGHCNFAPTTTSLFQDARGRLGYKYECMWNRDVIPSSFSSILKPLGALPTSLSFVLNDFEVEMDSRASTIEVSSINDTAVSLKLQQSEEALSPGTRSFFDKTPAGAAARRTYLKLYGGGLFAVIVLIFAVFSIFWGSLWKTPAHSLHGIVVVCSLFSLLDLQRFMSYLFSGFRRGHDRTERSSSTPCESSAGQD